jgi:hypothetical protein
MEVAMLGKLLAGTAVLAIAGSTLVLAQTPESPGPAYNQQQYSGPGQQPMQTGPGQDEHAQTQQPGQGPDNDDDDDDDDGPNAGQQQAQYGYQPQQQYSGPQQGYQPQQQYSGPQQGYQPQQHYSGPPQGYPPQQQYSAPQYGYPPQQPPMGPDYGAQQPPPGAQYGAQPQPQQQQQDPQFSLAGLPSAEDINAFVEGRLASLRAGLKLTTEQAKTWPAFEQASRDLAKLEAERAAQLRQAQAQQTATTPATTTTAKPAPGATAAQQPAQPPAPNVFEDLQRSADALVKDGAAFKKLADAGAALFKSLDEEQKQRFMTLSQGLLPH